MPEGPYIFAYLRNEDAPNLSNPPCEGESEDVYAQSNENQVTPFSSAALDVSHHAAYILQYYTIKSLDTIQYCRRDQYTWCVRLHVTLKIFYGNEKY